MTTMPTDATEGRGPVVVLSHPQDLHATTVIEALTARGVPTVLFDLADLPQRATISLHHGPDGSRVRLRRAQRKEPP